MLRSFMYLNTKDLDSYVSAVEDGLRVEVETESTTTGSRKVAADLKAVNGEVGRDSARSSRIKGADTAEARFTRLLTAVRGQEEELSWVDVIDPAVDLADIGVGMMVAGEADFFIPQHIQLLSKGEGGLGSVLGMMDAFAPHVEALGLDTKGLPDKSAMDAMRAFSSAMGSDLVAVGEFDESDWKVAGQLRQEHIRSTVEGQARFVGKVHKMWPEGEGRPLLALPGASLLPREQRRRMERTRPTNPDDDSFLMGPALMLEMLAVWR